MAYALVKWEQDGRYTVVSSQWVLHPKPLPAAKDLPVAGICRWTKKSQRYQVELLELSSE